MIKCKPQMVKNMAPKGARVELVRMNDRFAPPPGTMGTVTHVDDAGQIHVAWDNGSNLALIVGVDKFNIYLD